MNEIAQGRLDVEIRRHGQVLRTWVLKRIADTPAINDQEREASVWFHQLPVEQRSRLVTDLARLNIKGVNLFEIVTGPVGMLFTTYPQLFQIAEPRQELREPVQVQDQDRDQDLVETQEHATLAVAGAGGPGWYHGWKSFEFDLDGPAWPAD